MQNELLAKVLVVDDQPDVADALVSFVRSLGHVARVAYEPGPAIELAREFEPDIAFVDIKLRAADGRMLAARLRNELRSVRLIAMSGYDVGRHPDGGRPIFDDYLVKPAETDALLRVLRGFRDKPRGR